jgi:hypothetical protein
MIRTIFQFTSSVLVIAALLVLPGCGGSQAPASKPATEAGHSEGDGHDHSKDKAVHSEGDGHDHSKEEAKDK